MTIVKTDYMFQSNLPPPHFLILKEMGHLHFAMHYLLTFNCWLSDIAVVHVKYILLVYLALNWVFTGW